MKVWLNLTRDKTRVTESLTQVDPSNPWPRPCLGQPRVGIQNYDNNNFYSYIDSGQPELTLPILTWTFPRADPRIEF